MSSIMVHLFINRVHLFNIDPNIDYILMLVEQYHEGNCEDKEILTSIRKAVDASMQLRSKKECKGQILRSTPNTAPLICGAYNTQPEGLSTMA